jgi:hypothetical protein
VFSRTVVSSALDWERTVPRRLVHRSAISEVLLTGAARTGTDAYDVAVQWPRGHAFHRPDAEGRVDPLLILETVRQTAIYLAHTHYDIPLGDPFSMTGISHTITDPEAEPKSRTTPTAVRCKVTVTDHRRTRGVVSGLQANVDFTVEGHTFARGSGALRSMSPAQYASLAKRRRVAPATAPCSVENPPAPHTVGRAEARDVLIDPLADGTYRLVVPDPEHPVYFDHPLDHFPGLLLVEAARQAAVHRLGEPRARLISSALLPQRYTELAPEPLLTVRPNGSDGGLEFSVGQDGTLAATGRLSLKSPAGSGA